jgi:PIN domain nuclease of toxin-antitoxin system
VSKFVLDASAVLAFVKSERGGEIVGAHMNGGLMSAVNYSEVLKKSAEHGGSVEVTAELLEQAQIVVVPFGTSEAKQAAAIWPSVRKDGVSFADRACLMLAIMKGATVLTADKRMASTDLQVKVRLIRDRN